MRADVINIVETVYQTQPDQQTWLARLAESVQGFGRGLGVSTFSGRVQPGRGFVLEATALFGMSLELDGHMRKLTLAKPDLAADAIWRTGPSGTASDALGPELVTFHFDRMGQASCRDLLGVIAHDPSGALVGIAIPLPTTSTTPRREREQWDRVAAHLAAGQRLQHERARSETADEGDAIVRPDGHVEYAADSAKAPAARTSLREAAIAMERARSSLRHESPDEALSLWRALVAGRWSLVDRFESDGRRYLVARRNDPQTRKLAALTQREQQVAAYLALGHANKHIAYELGVSEPTVSDTARRAFAKLGISTRADLARLYPGNPADSESHSNAAAAKLGSANR